MEGEGWIALPQLRVETQLAALGRGEGPPGQPLNVPIVPASNFRGRVERDDRAGVRPRRRHARLGGVRATVL
jgi:hypothetical protein